MTPMPTLRWARVPAFLTRRTLYVAGVTLAGIIALVAVGGGWPLTARAPLTRDLADGRAGMIRFMSFTPARAQIARGRYEHHPVVIDGELRLPAGSGAPGPAVILMHGSDGLSATQRRYARRLRAEGMAVFLLNSFRGRGIDATVGHQEKLPVHAMVVDLYAALALLATHPRIDARQIAVIGWSKGGVAAQWAAREWYRSRLADGAQRFAAHAAFYAWCGEQEAQIRLTGAPLLFLAGGLDDWSGTSPCVDYVQRLSASGYDARIRVYENAHHGFDYDGAFKTFLANATSWSGCVYLARETGFVEQASEHFLPWEDLDGYFARCTRKGAHVATNAQARRQAMQALLEFLRETWGSPPRV